MSAGKRQGNWEWTRCRYPTLLTPAQRKAFAVADNNMAEIADWDYDALANILKDLPEQEIDLHSLGFGEAELDAILKPAEDFAGVH